MKAIVECTSLQYERQGDYMLPKPELRMLTSIQAFFESEEDRKGTGDGKKASHNKGTEN